MYYEYITAKCSNCKRMLYVKLTKVLILVRVNSGLGPNVIICESCQTKNITNNKEWEQMTLIERIRYILFSIIYGIVIGFIFSLPIVLIFEKANQCIDTSYLTNQLYAIITIPIALLIFLIQIIRIYLSNNRIKENAYTEIVANFWSWQTNLQFLFMLMIWLIIIILAIGLFIK